MGYIMAGKAKRVGKGSKRLDREKCLERFYENYARTGRIMQSVEEANFSYTVFYDWRQSDPSIDEKINELEERYQERLESEVDRRAVEGYDEVTEVTSPDGEITRTVRKKYSDALLIAKLKSRIARYREKLELSGEVKGQVLVVPALTQSPEDWDELVQEQKKLAE